MCGGIIGDIMGAFKGKGSSSAPSAPAPAPATPTVDDKAVRDAIDRSRAAEAGSGGRQSTMLTGAGGISIGMEKLQKKKLLGTPSKLGGE